MIDTSSLTGLKATIALLIERSGEAGRRVSELCNETGSTKGSVCKVLKYLVTHGLIVKTKGDVPRYYSAPSVSVGTPSVSVGTPSVSVGTPLVSVGIPSVSKPTTLTLTKLKQTNKQDLGISKNPQAEGKTSPNRVTTPEGAGKVAVVISSVAPAPVFPPRQEPKPGLPQEVPKVVSGGVALPGRGKRMPPVFAEVFAERAADRQVIVSGKPLTSLYLMVASVEAAGRYDVFVECVERVWKLVLENAEAKEKLPYDFIVHRAAYVFAMGIHKRVAMLGNSPEEFVALVKKRAGRTPMYPKMVGMLQDCYVAAGLGWDTSYPNNEVIYGQELSYAELMSKETGTEVLPRNELFPGFFYGRQVLCVGKGNAGRSEGAEEREEERNYAYAKWLEKLRRMPESERKECIDELAAVDVERLQAEMPPMLWKQFLSLRAPPEREEVVAT